MNPFILIPAQYQLLAKGVALLLIVIALAVAWHKFTGSYEAAGYAKCQLEDENAAKEQAIKDKIAKDKADEQRLADTKHHDTEQSAILNNLSNVINKERAKNGQAQIKLNDTGNQLIELRRSIADSLASVPNGEESARPTESGGVDYRAVLTKNLETCESAAALETIKYNSCINQFEANCVETGCR